MRDGIVEYAHEHDWSLTFFNLKEGGGPPEAVKYATQLDVDGVLSQFFTSEGADVTFAAEGGRPAVDLTLGRPDVDVPRVVPDDVASGRAAAGHFVERGFRNYVFFPDMDHIVLGDRLRGFREGIRQHADTMLTLERGLIPGFSRSELLGWLTREIVQLPKPLALMGLNDHASLLAADAAEAAGLMVPEQVAILGVDNLEWLCTSSSVPLSSVDPDFHRQGYEAARVLDGLMNGGPAPEEPILIPPKGVVARQSTNIRAVAHLGAARAVGFILRRYTNPDLSFDDIVGASGMTRRPLEVAFHNALDCTMGDFIRQTRLEHAQRLLRETDDPIGEAATASGFHNAKRLGDALRAATGLGPRAWRAKQRAEQ